MRLAIALLLALTMFASARCGVARADNNICLTREQAISVIAYKADIEHGGRVPKARLWAIMDRESGLLHCWPNGRVKVSPTGDYGIGQLNWRGVYRNCKINRYCNDMAKIYDPYVAVDLMLNYYEAYHDFCPWNPKGNYAPGCGYR